MDRRTVTVSHGHPNNESWVEREFMRANEISNKPRLILDEPLKLAMERKAIGGIVTGDFLIGYYTPTLIIMNKTSAMGKSEQRLDSMRGNWKQKVLPEDKAT